MDHARVRRTLEEHLRVPPIEEPRKSNRKSIRKSMPKLDEHLKKN